MDFNKDIVKYSVPHKCSQCTIKNNCYLACHNMDNSKCGKFTPNNMDKFLNDTIKYFQANVTKSKDKKLKRVYTYQGATNDKVTTLDTYYISFINDCISDLRKGRMTYVFSISHIWEILRFVQNIKAVYQGNGIIGLICNDEICENKSKILKG